MAKPKQNIYRKSKKAPICPHCDNPYSGNLDELFAFVNAIAGICPNCGKKYSAVRLVSVSYNTVALKS